MEYFEGAWSYHDSFKLHAVKTMLVVKTELKDQLSSSFDTSGCQRRALEWGKLRLLPLLLLFLINQQEKHIIRTKGFTFSIGHLSNKVNRNRHGTCMEGRMKSVKCSSVIISNGSVVRRVTMWSREKTTICSPRVTILLSRMTSHRVNLGFFKIEDNYQVIFLNHIKN